MDTSDWEMIKKKKKLKRKKKIQHTVGAESSGAR
jgi:hypothetical protein